MAKTMGPPTHAARLRRSRKRGLLRQERVSVEGDSEVAAVDAIGRRLVEDGDLTDADWQQSRRGVVVLNCRGKWTLRAFQRVLNGFAIPYTVVHDADAEGEGGANEAILKELGNDVSRRLVHQPNFEQELFQQVWQRDKPWLTCQKVKENGISDDSRRSSFCRASGGDRPPRISVNANQCP